jgi:hypothetical protein
MPPQQQQQHLALRVLGTARRCLGTAQQGWDTALLQRCSPAVLASQRLLLLRRLLLQ